MAFERTPAPNRSQAANVRRHTREATPAAAVLALQAAAGNRAVGRVLQRYVMKRASPTGWKYCSSWDQGTLYDTEEEARAADARLEAQHGGEMDWEPEARFPTVYSYTHTRSTSQLSDKPQGPHTAPHVLVAEAFGQLRSREEWLMVFYEQIRDPDQLLAAVLTEKGWTLAQLSFELQRLVYDYKNLYESVEAALWDSRSERGAIQMGIARLLELDPYGVYGWKTAKAASHRSTKGKGERKTKGFGASVDKGGQWRDEAAYKKFLATRERLTGGEYLLTDEELEYDGQLDGEYMSMDELIGAIVAGDEKVGNTIELYPTGEWVIHSVAMQTVKTDGAVLVTGVRIRLRRRGG